MEYLFLALLIFTPFTVVAAAVHASPILLFIVSAIAIIPLAKYIGDATESLAAHTSESVGGLLNATFGNATELIIGLFALNAGLITVVKASIVGSILGNLLLVLGTSIIVGGYKREKQLFNKVAAQAGASMLLLATIAIVIPAIFAATSANTSSHVIFVLSVFVSILMLIAYFSQLFFILHTHKHLYAHNDETPAKWGVIRSITTLVVVAIAISIVSDLLVRAISPVVQDIGWSQLFIGVIVVAIIGNVAEHFSAIQAAIKNKMELAVSITIGSATQIILFVAPVLVLCSVLLGHQMDLVFSVFELIAVIFAVFVTNAVVTDGESNWLEGVQLVIAYIIIAVAFFFFR